MGTNNLTSRSAGETIVSDFFNSIHQALEGEIVGRNTSGAPTAGQSLGTPALPFGTGYFNNITLNGSALDTSSITVPANRVISGQTRSTSDQPAFLKPAGAAGGASFDVEGATTNLVLAIRSASVTVSTDITKGSLTTAPSTNNTALVDDADATDQESTRTWGEYGAEKEEITIDTIGSELTSLDGTWQSFKINDGANDEYFFGYLDTTNNKITKIYRGYYYDDSYAPINRIKFADNDTITLMKTAYVFIEDNATTVDVTYNKPSISHTAPSSPATGDYWFDLNAVLWKRYDGASFQIIDRTFVGQAILDDTDCVGARSADFYFQTNEFNDVEVEIQTTEIIQGTQLGQKLFSYGEFIQYQIDLPSWNITTDRATAADMYTASEQASTTYYLYISNEGETIISDISPYKRVDLHGWYHPHNPWRCVGLAFNNGSSNLVSLSEVPFNSEIKSQKIYFSEIAASAGGLTSGSWVTRNLNTVDGASKIGFLDSNGMFLLPGKYSYSFSAQGNTVNRHQARMQNITNTSTEKLGRLMAANAANSVENTSIVEGDMALGVNTELEIQQRVETTNGTDGAGRPASFSVNATYCSGFFIRYRY